MADNEVQDGTTNFTGGQNASKSPDQVPDNAYYSGVNVSTDDGILSPRWGWEEKILKFPNTEFSLPTGLKKTFASVFPGGKFQAFIPYSIGSTYYLIAIVSGVIYLFNQDTFECSIIQLPNNSKLDEHAERINWSPAGRWLAIFDFPNYPIFIEKGLARRSNPADFEMPISTMGVYNQNRVIIANAGNEFTASDPAAYGFPKGPISFTEIETPSSPFFGQLFQLSTNYNNDPLTALAFIQTVDTSTGIGPLLASTANAVYSYHTEVPRSQWEGGQFGSLFIHETGIAGPRAFANINSDIFFLDPECYVRTASMSRDEQGKWGKTPISLEVKNYLKTLDPDLVKYGVICYFKNKIFITANPYRSIVHDTLLNPVLDYAHGGFVVLELENVSTFTEGQGPPAWAGLWTGVRPMDMVVNNKRAFVISKDDDNVNRIYELRPDIRYDIIGEKRQVRQVKSKIYTKEYFFKTPFNNKQIKSIEFSPRQIRGDFALSVQYKTSQSSRFLFWNKFEHTAPWRSCQFPLGCVDGFLPHEFKEINLGSPDEEGCSPLTGDSESTFRKVQLLIEITGVYWELTGFLIRAILLSQNDTESNQCEVKKGVEICRECNSDWLIEGKICQEMHSQQ